MEDQIELVISGIIEKIEFHKKELFLKHLTSCIHRSADSSQSTYAKYDNVVFRIQDFFKGFSPFINEFGKERKLNSGVHALYIILNELGLDVDKAECFLLFHLRDLGKFRMNEEKLKKDLKGLWGTYKEYALSDQDFSYTLKSLKRQKLIDYRKGNLHLSNIAIIRYKTGQR